MLTLLHLLSAVALLVWGTHIVRTGVMRVFGARLRTVLSRSVEKKPLAFCAGIGVTALVQSSNATTMLVTSFVAQDLVALAPALVIVLGADVGTALMARVLTFDLSWLSPLLIFIGVIFFLGRKQSRAGQLGRVGIGLGLILLALELIVQAVTPITQANGVQVIFASLTGDILLDALIGAMFAIISYSSLAAVLLTATLTAAGIISFPVALCLSVLGICFYGQMLAASLEREMEQDYAMYLRCRGLREGRILLFHAFPHAVVDLLPSFAQMLGLCLANAAIVERVFSLSGLGYLIIDAVVKRDSPVIHAAVLVLALTLVLLDTAAELLQYGLRSDMRAVGGRA